MFRKVLFWSHLTSGVCIGIVVFIMSITGVMLTYEKQLLAWADERAARVEPPATGVPPATVGAIINAVRLRNPTATINTVTRRADPRAPASVTLDAASPVLVHPYAGTVIGEAPTRMRSVFRSALEWHRFLAGTGEYRAIGKAITGAGNLMFLFLMLSGMYLWMPRRWTRASLSAVVVPRWRHPTGKARDFNWHNALGLWGAVPLAVVVASAVVISYPWASDVVYRVAGETPPPRPAASAPTRPALPARNSDFLNLVSIEDGWRLAEQQVPAWKTITLRLPAQPAAPLVFTIDEGWPGQPQKRVTLTIDSQTGSVLRSETFDQLSRGRRWRSLVRFAHTGELWGLPGQTIAGIASAGACLLVYTGFALALRRFRAWRSRAKTSAPGLRKAA